MSSSLQSAIAGEGEKAPEKFAFPQEDAPWRITPMAGLSFARPL